jgi:hypothetical protein
MPSRLAGRRESWDEPATSSASFGVATISSPKGGTWRSPSRVVGTVMDRSASLCYGTCMDSAISIPASLSQQANDLAQRLHKSLSQLAAEALVEYISRHDPSTITERLDAVYDSLPETEERFVTETTCSVLRQVEW